MALDTLAFVLKKFKVADSGHYPIEVPDFGRDQMALMFAELGYTKGVEIGTEKGRYSEVLCKSNPGLRLQCVDPYEAYAGYENIFDQDLLDRYYLEASYRLEPYKATILKKYSMDAVKDFADGELDFVYIDGNHNLPHVVEDLFFWSQKVKAGGIISGHDYVSFRKQCDCHVVEAVHGFTSAYRIKPWFVLGRKEKWQAEVRDQWRSWMWVKA